MLLTLSTMVSPPSTHANCIQQQHAALAARLPSVLGQRVLVAGDHLEDASINGAMRSGRLAAERCLAALDAR